MLTYAPGTVGYTFVLSCREISRSVSCTFFPMYCLHHVAKMAGEVVVVTYMWWAYVCLCEEQLLLFLGGGGKVEAVL